MLSERVKNASESITLKLNAQATELRQQGKDIYNLTAGQLPYHPDSALLELIPKQLQSLSSFQYSPVPGLPELRKKAMEYVQRTREIKLNEGQFDCVVSTGAKQSLFNLIAALVDPGDEVILLTPYWVSYPEMVRYWGGRNVTVAPVDRLSDGPSMASITQAITDKTKAIMLNTPGNPSGVYYPAHWVEQFAQLMMQYPQIQIISDEIYSQLYYAGPGPKFPYHFCPELLDRTFIIDGISKSMACTGLRIGFCLGNTQVMKAMSKIQGQSTSGANSLIQKALEGYDFTRIERYLTPVKEHLQKSSAILKEKLEQYDLSQCWYQINGAFYFMMSFEGMPVLAKLRQEANGSEQDYAATICAKLIEHTGVVMVPSTDFGQANGARISMVLESGPFTEALDRAFRYLCS